MRVYACLMRLLTIGIGLLPEGERIVASPAEIENLLATAICENS
jgi:hypothetical protein